MKKRIQLHNESVTKKKVDTPDDGTALPAYLLDREQVTRAKVLSNTLKQKRKEKAGKWAVPLPRVKPISEDEMFRVVRTGKRKKKQWKRMVTKVMGDEKTCGVFLFC
jgi:ribosome biogenesis protein NSA2